MKKFFFKIRVAIWAYKNAFPLFGLKNNTDTFVSKIDKEYVDCKFSLFPKL